MFPELEADRADFRKNPHIDHSVFMAELHKRVPKVYHELFKDAIRKGYAFHNKFLWVGLDFSDDLLEFVVHKSAWFYDPDNVPMKNCWIRKDGLVIYALGNFELRQIATCFLARKIETVQRNYACVQHNTTSVEQAIQLVTRPTGKMKVAAFELIRNGRSGISG